MLQGRIILSAASGAALAIGLIVWYSVSSMPTQPNNNGVDSNRYFCPPIDLNNVDTGFPLRQPTTESLPSGYLLQAVEDQESRILMYYDNNPLCPLSASKVRELMENDAITIGINKASDSGYSNAEQFQTEELQYFKSKGEISDRVQAVDIAGYKGVGYDVIGAVDQYGNPIKIGGQTAGVLFFYHDMDDTVYAVYANQPLNELVEIAKGIPRH